MNTAYDDYIDREWPHHKDEPAYMPPEDFAVWIRDNYEPTDDWHDILVSAIGARDYEVGRKGRKHEPV